MKVYMDIDRLRGHIHYGHLERDVSFSKEEEKEFKSLFSKWLDDEELTEEEQEKLYELSYVYLCS